MFEEEKKDRLDEMAAKLVLQEARGYDTQQAEMMQLLTREVRDVRNAILAFMIRTENRLDAQEQATKQE